MAKHKKKYLIEIHFKNKELLFKREYYYDNSSVLSPQEQLKNTVAEIFEIGCWVEHDSHTEIVPPHEIEKIIINNEYT